MTVTENTMELTTIEDLLAKVKEGSSIDWSQFGNVKTVYSGDLVLFNYTRDAQFEGRWNWFERISRGLILNWHTGEVVARPFDKFFNWLEKGHTTNGYIVIVTGKIDGSLGILYRRPNAPAMIKYAIATRGSFDGEQATWATHHLWASYDLCDLPEEYTLLFEIVYPDNRIVVDYGDQEDLYLLAVRNRFTGEYLPFYPDVYQIAQKYGFPTPQIWAFNSIEDIIARTDTLPGTQEGWVVEFSDGQRFKFKGDHYLELHRLVTQTSFKHVVDAVASGAYDAWIDGVPDEFTEQIREWHLQILETVCNVTDRIVSAFAAAPKTDRKTFALWVMEYHRDIASYLFRKIDDQEYLSLIYRREF